LLSSVSRIEKEVLEIEDVIDQCKDKFEPDYGIDSYIQNLRDNKGKDEWATDTEPLDMTVDFENDFEGKVVDKNLMSKMKRDTVALDFEMKKKLLDEHYYLLQETDDDVDVVDT